MYITRDYCKSSPWTAICDMINDACLTQLSPGTTRLLSMTAEGATLTKIVIDVNISTSSDNTIPPVALDTYFYNRLNLTTFFKQSRAYNVNGLPLPITTMDIAKMIGNDNEIVFDLADLVHETFTEYSPTTDITLRAHPDSLRFVGTLKVRLVNTFQRDISNLGTVLEFPDVNPLFDPTRLNGDYYINGFDFTPMREVLRSIPEGTYVDTRLLVSGLAKITGYPWKALNATVARNIVNTVVQGQPACLVRYHGAPVPEWSNQTEYNRVLVLELNPAYCTDVVGHLRLHYN